MSKFIIDVLSDMVDAKREIDKKFGDGYAKNHPELISSILLSASIQNAADSIAGEIQDLHRAVSSLDFDN